jgi:hypothetical protein
LLVPAVLVAVAAGCGGSSSESESEGDNAAAEVETVESGLTTVTGPEGSVAALLAEGSGEDSALIFGSGDFAVGDNRVSFLVVDSRGELSMAPRARVRVARGGFDAIPELETTAENIPVGVPPEAEPALDDFDAPAVWVLNVTLDEPGQYTLLVEPEGEQLQAYGQIEVAEQPVAPAVGDEAFPSDNPTVDDGFPEDITTASPPDVELLQYSIEQSIADGVPFVVTFATPEFCESRVCGPVVDIVEGVRNKLESEGVRFIHVEVFEGNDPNNGFNQWMREWNLPTEPWTFLVDGTGTIRGRFEGLVTTQELEQAVRELLL